MRLLIDMNLSPDWVTLLVSHGYQTVHWASIGRADTGDQEIMRYAQDHGYAVLTLDLDFGIMLAGSAAAKPSVIQLRSDKVLPVQIGAQVLKALRELGDALERGALVTIHPEKTRLKVLPFDRR